MYIFFHHSFHLRDNYGNFSICFYMFRSPLNDLCIRRQEKKTIHWDNIITKCFFFQFFYLVLYLVWFGLFYCMSIIMSFKNHSPVYENILNRNLLKSQAWYIHRLLCCLEFRPRNFSRFSRSKLFFGLIPTQKSFRSQIYYLWARKIMRYNILSFFSLFRWNTEPFDHNAFFPRYSCAR